MARRHREVLDSLLARVVDGRYAVGTLLPKEERIAEEFDISRGTAREALRALEERRVALVRHGRGATVQPPEEWAVLDPAVARALGSGRRRRGFLAELAELRELLEPYAAGLAAERATARDRAAIRAAAAAPGDAGELRRALAAAARNRPLAATLRALAAMHEPAPAAEEWAAVAEAVAAGDAAAAREAARRAARRRALQGRAARPLRSAPRAQCLTMSRHPGGTSSPLDERRIS